MEFEDLSEKMEWEEKRVAVAFGVEIERSLHTNMRANGSMLKFYWARINTVVINWQLQKSVSDIKIFEKGKEDDHPCRCRLSWFRQEWIYGASDYEPHNELMARGLYCLGFEDESILSQLPSLSAHEKLELRLSLPREFWPQKWLDEE